MLTLLKRREERLDQLAAALAKIDLPAPEEGKRWVDETGVIHFSVKDPGVEELAHLIVRSNFPTSVKRKLLRQHERELRALVQRKLKEQRTAVYV